MIEFINFEENKPNLIFKGLYHEAEKLNQNHIDAACISSFDRNKNEVDARFVNIKYIKNDEWVFFSNYESPKSKQFINHNQISIIFFWPKIASQIRMKALISKISRIDSKNYFAQRDPKKNALAISSSQSMKISSYDRVVEKYNHCLSKDNLQDCPDNWGGYAFTPYYFEFWKGEEFRLNKREVFEKKHDEWKHFLLQP